MHSLKNRIPQAFDSSLVDFLQALENSGLGGVVIFALQLVGLLQLVSIFIFGVIILLRFDGGVHPLLLHFGSRQVEIRVGLLIGVQGSLGCAKCLFVLFFRFGQEREGRLQLRLNSRPFIEMLQKQRGITDVC